MEELTNEKKVLKYIRANEKVGKLTFGDRETNIFGSSIKPLEYDRSDYSLSNIIMFVLKANKERETIDPRTGRVQCHINANRSAVDIWRLVKFYQPKTRIFDVMRELYKLTHEDSKLDMNFCEDIEKRVFDHDVDESNGHEYGDDDSDEFGLDWYDWKTIGL